ncbi:MAG: CopG family transcriptional regulator [Ramlibacter sp.]
MSIQLKTARLTVLLDPARKQEFERVCRGNDMTPSQVLRHLIRDFVAEHSAKAASARPVRKPVARHIGAPAPAKRANSRHA